MSCPVVGMCTDIVRWNKGKEARLRLMHLGIPFPKKLGVPRQKENIKEQLAMVMVCRLLSGTPILGKHLVKLRPVCKAEEGVTRSKGNKSVWSMQRGPQAEISEESMKRRENAGLKITAVSPVLTCVEGETQGQRWRAGKPLTIFIFYLHETMMDYLCLIGIYDPMSDI